MFQFKTMYLPVNTHKNFKNDVAWSNFKEYYTKNK